MWIHKHISHCPDPRQGGTFLTRGTKFYHEQDSKPQWEIPVDYRRNALPTRLYRGWRLYNYHSRPMSEHKACVWQLMVHTTVCHNCSYGHSALTTGRGHRIEKTSSSLTSPTIGLSSGGSPLRHFPLTNYPTNHRFVMLLTCYKCYSRPMHMMKLVHNVLCIRPIMMKPVENVMHDQ